jgi:hypothetical protein
MSLYERIRASWFGVALGTIGFVGVLLWRLVKFLAGVED